MNLKAATCEKCNAPLSFDMEHRLLFCQHCGTTYFIEPDQSDKEAELIETARKWQKIGCYDKAFQCFKQCVELNPANDLAWWEIIKYQTDDFNHVILSYDELNKLKTRWQSLVRLGVNPLQQEKMVTYAEESHECVNSGLKFCRATHGSYCAIHGHIMHKETLKSLAHLYGELLALSHEATTA